MKLINRGKTKDVFDLEDGTYLLRFKDDVTGTDGVFDPGANTVGLSIEGMGRGGLRLTDFFFKKLSGVPTHYVSADVEKAEMTVRPAKRFGYGLEVICRYRSTGSFMRRYGQYAAEGQFLDGLVEFTLKDDERGDPPISKDALVALGILTKEEYKEQKKLAKHISRVIKDTLAAKGLELYDIKLEFGRGSDGGIMLIDEISAGNMRVYQHGKIMPPLELVALVLS
ncbi:MAG: phosphoribosylaminoimidazolesuccinocarboxamide synthase [Oscillospiraceae bacterium]|jgi:phosphoribosylaminoimidazole-succinocarboxamide synthase|nr:phosphoribosylaminoimidazolesuccinocarboxamide synthase [Oscillospiraceae bacterium]